MSAEPFIGQIQPFAFHFAPRGWAKCDGQLLQISQHTALFSLLGTTYGGDGRTTFALPDLRGRVAIHHGQGPGLVDRKLGEDGGEETVTLSVAQMPRHTHQATGTARCNSGDGTDVLAQGNVPATDGGPGQPSRDYHPTDNADMKAAGVAVNVDDAGGSMAHNNMQPFLTINWCIALVGIYPSRN